MKFLFIIQGEGRGHLTQALALEEMLKRNGHEVVGALVGKSSTRTLPKFFSEHLQAPIELFASPNFRPSADNKRFNLLWSVLSNLIKLPLYIKSMLFIRRSISRTQPDMVINFYEVLTGLTYLFMWPSSPYICIGHQYLFLHPDFRFPPQKSHLQLNILRFFTWLTSVRTKRRLALSFYSMSAIEDRRLVTVPPLLRKEIALLRPRKGEYIHGYLLNSGFATEVQEYHQRHPEVSLRFFWDKKGADEKTRIDDTLSFYQLDDAKFLQGLAGCKAYATTAGFESICEALYLGKPVMMVPAHIEQDCNAFDAVRAGAGVICPNFDIDRLMRFTFSHFSHNDFICWASSSEIRIIREIERAGTDHKRNVTRNKIDMVPGCA